MDRGHAERLAKTLGIEQRHARTRPGAQDDKGPVIAAAPQPFVFAAVYGLRRQLGDSYLGIAPDRPEPAVDAIAVGSRSVEGRDRRDALAADVQESRAGVEPLDGEFLDRDIGAE
jgi:hypothetical protein